MQFVMGFFIKIRMLLLLVVVTLREEAHYLSKLCNKVTMLVRKDKFRASKIMQERVMKTDNIEVLFNTTTLEIKGDGQVVNSISVKNNLSGNVYDIPATGFFVAIGHKPNTDIFKPFIEMNESGYIVNKAGSTKTNIEGVFVSGDAADFTYRQAVTEQVLVVWLHWMLKGI